MVESLLSFHPEFDPATDTSFSDEERAIFKKYFLPEWEAHGDDYQQTLRDLVAAEPDIGVRAESVLDKFCLLHNVRR